MFATIQDIIDANHTAGQHWFEPGTMDFFSSQIEPKVYRGCYFISSEQYTLSDTQRARGMPELPRGWTIHMVTPDGWVTTMGEFQQYPTFGAAETSVLQLPPCQNLPTDPAIEITGDEEGVIVS